MEVGQVTHHSFRYLSMLVGLSVADTGKISTLVVKYLQGWTRF